MVIIVICKILLLISLLRLFIRSILIVLVFFTMHVLLFFRIENFTWTCFNYFVSFINVYIMNVISCLHGFIIIIIIV